MRLLPILSTLLGATAALATPYPRRRNAWSPRPAHLRLNRDSGPVPSFAPPKGRFSAAVTSSSASSSATESWKGGAILLAPSITSASAVFVVPEATVPSYGPTAGNDEGTYGASYWVGLGGVTCTSGASLRAGVDTFWDQGFLTYVAWYEWSRPGGRYTDFGNFTVAPGDTVRLFAAAGADSSGRVAAETLGADGKARQCVSHSWPAGTGPEVCAGEAAWVVEDDPLEEVPDVPMALANFTMVEFRDLEATTGEGGRIDVVAAALQTFDINIEGQGGQLTECKATEEGLDCRRVVGGQ